VTDRASHAYNAKKRMHVLFNGGTVRETRSSLLLAVMALAAGCAAPTPSPIASATLLPTLAAVAPEAIAVRLARLQGIGPAQPTLTIYEGGRVLTLSEENELFQRQLTQAGIDLVQAEMLETGLFEQSGSYPIEIREGAQPPGIEVPFDRFTLATENGTVQVGSVPYEDLTWMVHSPEREALIALAERLVDLSWLPADAWLNVDAVPYQPRAYLLLGGDVPINEGLDPAGPDMTSVNWPLPGGPERLGAPFVSADGTQSFIDRCLVIGPEAFAGLVRAVADAGFDWSGSASSLFHAVSVPWRSRGIEVDLVARPLLPEESLSCADKSDIPNMDL
jgi:hypothetical protein